MGFLQITKTSWAIWSYNSLFILLKYTMNNLDIKIQSNIKTENEINVFFSLYEETDYDIWVTKKQLLDWLRTERKTKNDYTAKFLMKNEECIWWIFWWNFEYYFDWYTDNAKKSIFEIIEKNSIKWLTNIFFLDSFWVSNNFRWKWFWRKLYDSRELEIKKKWYKYIITTANSEDINLINMYKHFDYKKIRDFVANKKMDMMIKNI